MSKRNFSTPSGRAQDSWPTRIRLIGDLALNDATECQDQPDRDFFNRHLERLSYVRCPFAHEREDWAARGAVFDQPGTIDLVVVRQFANNSFRVRVPFAACSVVLDPNKVSDTEAQQLFETLIANRTIKSPEGEMKPLRAVLERFAEAIMRKK